MKNELYYSNYLNLETILNAQHPVKKTAHDEHLFIITHQTYELWFKQIIYEISSICDLMSHASFSSEQFNSILLRLERCTKIFSVLIEQMNILETMSALGFLSFRDDLIPASGFQSVQFKVIEALLGLKREKDLAGFQFNDDDKLRLLEQSKHEDLFSCFVKWLEAMPFNYELNTPFWKNFFSLVQDYQQKEEHFTEREDAVSQNQCKIHLKLTEKNQSLYLALLNQEKFNEKLNAHQKKLPFSATVSALFIFLYCDEPTLSLPYRIIQELMNLEEKIALWRFRHLAMVQRMLGFKMGTGGTSGQEYLKKQIESKSFFKDFFELASYLIPREKIPAIPRALKKKMKDFFD